MWRINYFLKTKFDKFQFSKTNKKRISENLRNACNLCIIIHRQHEIPQSLNIQQSEKLADVTDDLSSTSIQELENKYQDVQSRSEVMNQVRRNRSLQRNIKRENNKARRALNKKSRRGTLNEQDIKDLKYYNDNREKAVEYKSGKEKLFGFFVGQAMKASSGKANPQLINEILKKKL